MQYDPGLGYLSVAAYDELPHGQALWRRRAEAQPPLFALQTQPGQVQKAQPLALCELQRRGDVRRAKLYYLRERSGKAARIRELLVRKENVQAAAE